MRKVVPRIGSLDHPRWTWGPSLKNHNSLSPRRKPGPIFQRPVFMDPGLRRGDNRATGLDASMSCVHSGPSISAGHGVHRSKTEIAATTESKLAPHPRSGQSSFSVSSVSSVSERKQDAFRSYNLGCHPGESRGLYSRGLCLWTPAFAGVTREWVLPPELVSCPRGSTQSVETLWLI